MIFVALAFFAGSIPFGVIVASRKGTDIRQHGSGNIGATNVARVLGPAAGGLVLVLDAAKGALPVWLARDAGAWTLAATAYAAILGHCFSPWLHFRGGKGVATALGAFAVLSPILVAIGAGAFAVTFALTRIVAVGSLVGTAAIAIALVVRGELPFALLGVATFALLVYTHRGNLARLVTRSR